MTKQQQNWAVAIQAVEKLQALNITVCNVCISATKPVITIEPPKGVRFAQRPAEVSIRRGGGELVRIRTGMFEGCAVRWLNERIIDQLH